MAPEQTWSEDYSFPVDVWSYGCTLVRLFTLRNIYAGDYSVRELLYSVAHNELRPIEVQIEDVPHPDVLILINDCLQFQGNKRPSFKNIEKRLKLALDRCCSENVTGNQTGSQRKKKKRKKKKKVVSDDFVLIEEGKNGGTRGGLESMNSEEERKRREEMQEADRKIERRRIMDEKKNRRIKRREEKQEADRKIERRRIMDEKKNRRIKRREDKREEVPG